MKSTPLPFSFPLDLAHCNRLRKEILKELLQMDPAFASIPVKSISPSTCSAMLTLYDQHFLCGFLKKSYTTLDVTLSSRLVRSAGKFIYAKNPHKRLEHAEIRMSSDFLYRLTDGPFSLNGLSASTPQEAFLIVFEHELCHALEVVLFGATGHSNRFLSLANGLFSHTDTKHSLPTRSHEASDLGVSIGSRVSFLYKGRQLTGIVSYIGKTATVFVPSTLGTYRDRKGIRYAKYRVPLSILKEK